MKTAPVQTHGPSSTAKVKAPRATRGANVRGERVAQTARLAATKSQFTSGQKLCMYAARSLR